MSILTDAYCCLSLGVQHKNRPDVCLTTPKSPQLGVLLFCLGSFEVVFLNSHCFMRSSGWYCWWKKNPTITSWGWQLVYSHYLQGSTLSPIVMQVEHHPKWKETNIGGTHFLLPWLWEEYILGGCLGFLPSIVITRQLQVYHHDFRLGNLCSLFL